MVGQSKRNPSHLIIAANHFGIAGFFAYAFYDRFWRWRHEISEVSTSFTTPDGANVTSSGMFWILPAVVFLVLGGIRVARYVCSGRAQPQMKKPSC
jgi:hypothetical protein